MAKTKGPPTIMVLSPIAFNSSILFNVNDKDFPANKENKIHLYLEISDSNSGFISKSRTFTLYPALFKAPEIKAIPNGKIVCLSKLCPIRQTMHISSLFLSNLEDFIFFKMNANFYLNLSNKKLKTFLRI